MKTQTPRGPQTSGPTRRDKAGELAVPAAAASPAPDPLRVPQAVGNQAFQRLAPQQRDDPEAVQIRLGGGRALDDTVRSRMESAFGADFSDVRLHTDASAGVAAQELKARAFTVGQDVAFAAGQYQPGTLVGDALIAHELAHVLQQRGGPSAVADKQESGGGGGESLEQDADTAAAGAVVSLWGGAHGGMTGITPAAQPIRKSGLRLARCDNKPAAPAKKSVTIKPTKLHGSTYGITSAVDFANKKVFNQANVEVKKAAEETLDEPKSKAILGDDLILDEYKDPATPTAEETALFKVNPLSGAVSAYFVKKLSDGHTGEAFWPALGHGFVGFAVSNIAPDQTLSHELGHVLLNDGGHRTEENNLMHPVNIDSRTKLEPEQITKIRNSPFVT